MEAVKHRPGCIECCEQKQREEYPANVCNSVQYGRGGQASVVKLSVDHKMPFEQIGYLFSDMYGYELNNETGEGT